jgi:DUF4097 and DUF4098 domain-containing protein YvlB
MPGYARPVRLLPGALVAALAVPALALLLGAGCGPGRKPSVIEDRTASAIPLGTQAAVLIQTRTADVHLVASPDDTVRVLTYKRIQSMSGRSVETLARQVRVTMERQGETLYLRVREPERHGSKVTIQAGPWRIRRSVEIEITVAVPARARIAVETERGDIDAHGLTQALSTSATSGDCDLVDLSGPVEVQTTSGDVSLRQLRAPAVVRVTSGDVDAVEVSGSLTVRATSGDVSASVQRGPVRVECSSGDVEILDAVGNVFASTSSGDVRVETSADSVSVETASGDISADLAAAPQFVRVKSSSGTVTLKLPPGSGGAVDLQTASGAMQVKSAVQVETMTRNRFAGRLGGTGEVQVRTSSGDITLVAHASE